MKINTIKSPFNYHRCTGQQDCEFIHILCTHHHHRPLAIFILPNWDHPLRPPPPTACWLGKPLLFFLLSMNLAPLRSFYECDRAVIVCCDWLTFSTGCRGPPCCVHKGFHSFRGAEACVQTQRSICLRHSSAPFGFTIDLFFSLCAHCTRCLSLICQWGLSCYKFEWLQIFLVWKWLCTCLFQTSILSFWTNAQRQPCLVIL